MISTEMVIWIKHYIKAVIYVYCGILLSPSGQFSWISSFLIGAREWNFMDSFSEVLEYRLNFIICSMWTFMNKGYQRNPGKLIYHKYMYWYYWFRSISLNLRELPPIFENRCTLIWARLLLCNWRWSNF